MDPSTHTIIVSADEELAHRVREALSSCQPSIDCTWVTFRNALHVLRREAKWDTGIVVGQELNAEFLTLVEKIVSIQPRLPVIALAEPFSPEAVVDVMDRGAIRYLPLDHLPSLPGILVQATWKSWARRMQTGGDEFPEPAVGSQAYMDLSPDGMAITDLEGVLMRVNPRAAELFGYANSEDMKGIHYLDLIAEEDRGMVSRMVEKAEDGGQSQLFESRVRRSDGSDITLELNMTMIWDRIGNPAGYLGIGRDVTERKQAEKALRESEAFAQKILTSSLNGLYIYDVRAGVITFINPQYTQLTGYTLHNLQQMSKGEFLSRFHTDDRMKVISHIEGLASAADGEIVEIEYRFLTADNRWIWCLSRETIFTREADGSVRQYIGTFLDITERKQMEEEHRITQQLYKAILEDQTELICRFKPDGKLTYVNGAYSRFYGVDRDQMIGMEVAHFIPEEEYPNVLESLANLSVEKPVAQYPERGRRANGDMRWIMWTDRMILGKDGSVVEYQSVGRDITEQKKIEDILQKERNFYSAILDTASALVVIMDPDGNVLQVNRACKMISGYSIPEILGRGLWKRVIVAAEVDRLWTYFSELKNGNPNKNVVTSWLTKDGELRHILWTTTILFDDQNVIEHIVATGIDITDRTNAVEEIQRLNADLEARVALRTAQLEKTNQDLRNEIRHRLHLTESRTQLIEILEETPDIVTIGNLEGELSYLNKAGRDLMALPDDLDITGYKLHAPYAPEAQTRVMKEAFPYALKHGVWSGECAYLNSAGNEVPILLVIIAHQKGDGNVQYLSTIARDISVRKQVEQQLRESEARFRSVFEGSPIGIVISTPDGRAIQTNSAFQQMLGYSQEELEQMRFLEITHPDDRTMNLTYMNETLAGRFDQYKLEKRYIKKNGEVLWVRLYASVVRGLENEVLFAISLVEDITEPQRIREELQHALEQEIELNELKSRFVSMTSHEFRTPLSTILSSAELLEHYSHRWSDQKKVDHLRRIQSAVKHLTGMLDEVLVIGRVEAGMVSIDLRPLDLVDMLSDLVEEVSLGVGTQHEIRLRSHEEIFPVRMDEGLLRQILVNLLTNAVKYSPVGSCIELDLRKVEERIVIQISDEGVGIPADDLARLFEPFYRGQNTNHIPGTGLGLTIVKRSLDYLHGTITVDSQERIGTTFTVEIPIPVQEDDGGVDLGVGKD